MVNVEGLQIGGNRMLVGNLQDPCASVICVHGISLLTRSVLLTEVLALVQSLSILRGRVFCLGVRSASGRLED